MDACGQCGRAADVVVKHASGRTRLCPACLDKRFPSLRLGSLRRAFIRYRQPTDRCPYCGWTGEQLKATALVGCPLCYEALDIPWPSSAGPAASTEATSVSGEHPVEK